MKKIFQFVVIVILSSLSVSSFSQDSGTLDPTFATAGTFTANNGFNDLFTDVKVQSDQKIVCLGITYNTSWMASIEVVRLLADGTYDPSFGTNGVFTFSLNYESNGYAISILDDGKILIGGITTGATGYDILLLRLDENGTLDNTFGTAGVTVQDMGPGDDIVYAMTVQDDGRILVAGIKSDLAMLNAPMVARFTADGLLDTSFGTNGMVTVPVTESENEFTSVLVQPDGKILASGHYANSITSFNVLLSRFTADGAPDNTFGTSGSVILPVNNLDDEAYGMQLTENGDIVIAGFTVTASYEFRLLLAKFDGSGAIVSSFGDNGTVIFGTEPMAVGYDMLIQPDNKILVAGCYGTGMVGPRSFAIWRYLENGTADTTFGTSGMTTTAFFGNADDANALCLQSDGKVVVAGKARSGSDLDYAVARYTNDIQTGVSTCKPSEITVSPNPVRRGDLITIGTTTNKPVSVSITGIAGNTLSVYNQTNATAGSLRLQIPANLATGLYILKITDENGATNFSRILVTE